MEEPATLPSNGLDAARQIVEEAEKRGVRLRMLGGLAFKQLCPSSRERYARDNKDLDLMGRREDSKRIVGLMEALGYRPREMFNKLNMGQRLIYYDMGNRRRVDIFLDEFTMCHRFNFKESILADTYTLPITQLVMTKLQVVEMTDKEYVDLVAAFHDFEVGDRPGAIRADEISDLCSRDWGIYVTFTRSIGSLMTRAQTLAEPDGSVVALRLRKLDEAIRASPKTLAWRMRARIGERARWYELPESDDDAALG